MDYKEQLKSLLKEAENLTESELEQVPGTDLWVKKGEVAKLFSSVEQEIKEEQEQYYNTKANEILTTNQDKIAKLERFNKNLDNINANYEKLTQQLAKLQGKVESIDSERLDKITHDVREYAENRDILIGFIADLAKNEINANFVEAIKEQMDRIRNDFLISPKGTKIGYGDNGLSILASDKPEYDSLIGLLRLMNTMDTKKRIVAVDGIICVNESQVEDAKRLLSKVKAFKSLKTETLEEKALATNQKLIDEIVAELRNIESEVEKSKVAAIYLMDNGVMMPPAFKDRYQDLIKLLRYLNQANDKKFALTPVWDGIAYVNGTDKDAFIELMSRTEPLKQYNPNIKKQDANSKLISELEDYLKSMEDDYNRYNGVTNIASEITKANTIVLEGQASEYDYIYDIIDILKDTEGKELYDVLGIASVSYENIPRFEFLVKQTKKLGNRISEPEENKLETEKIKQRLIELNKNAQEKVKENPNVKLAPNGTVLDSDYEEYQILVDKLKYLDASKGKKGLEDVGGVQMVPGFAPEYKKLDDKLKALEIRKNYEQNNAKKITEIEEEINRLSILEKDSITEEKIKALTEMKEALTITDWSDENLVVDGTLMVNDAEKYNKVQDKLSELKELEKRRIYESNNAKKLAEIEEKIQALQDAARFANFGTLSFEATLIEGIKYLNMDIKKLNSLTNIKKCLENAKSSQSLKLVGNIMIDVNDEEKYNQSLEELNNIEKKEVSSRRNFTIEIAKLVDKAKNAPIGIKPEEAVIIEGKKVLNSDREKLNELLTELKAQVNQYNLVYEEYANHISELGADKNPESKKQKVSIRKLKDKLKFKKKKKEIAAEGVSKTLWERITKGKIHPVASIKKLASESAKAYNEARDKVRRKAAQVRENRELRRKKGIQEQVEEDLNNSQEQQANQTAEQIGQNVTEEILKNSKKRLLDIMVEQNNLDENSPEYQALDKEARELSAKIAEIANITPDKQVDFEAIGEKRAKPTSTATPVSSKDIPPVPVDNIAPSEPNPPVVTLPPTETILNTLDGSGASSTSGEAETIESLEKKIADYQMEYEIIGDPMNVDAMIIENKIADLNDKLDNLRGGTRK